MIDTEFVEKISSNNDQEIQQALLEIVNSKVAFEQEELEAILAVIEPLTQTDHQLTKSLAITALKRLNKQAHQSLPVSENQEKNENGLNESRMFQNLFERLRQALNELNVARLKIFLIFILVILVFAFSRTLLNEQKVKTNRGNIAQTGYFTGHGPASKKLLWKFKAGSSIISSPTVADGQVFFGCIDNYFYAVDAVNGNEKWKFMTGELIQAAPVVCDNVVYFGSGDHFLYALDATSGKEKWKFKTEGSVVSSAVISDGLIYFGSNDTYLYALDISNGKEKWKFKTQDSINSDPAIANGSVFFGGSDYFFYAIDSKTGKEKWKFRANGKVFSTSVSGGLVFFGSEDHFLYAIDAVTGKEKWKFKTNNWVSATPAVFDGVVYVGSFDGHVYAVDIETGQEKWKFRAESHIRSSPIVTKGTIYFGGWDRYVYALDLLTGKQKWKYSTSLSILSSPTIDSQRLYIGGGDGYLYAFGEKTTKSESWFANPDNFSLPQTEIVKTVYKRNVPGGTMDVEANISLEIQNLEFCDYIAARTPIKADSGTNFAVITFFIKNNGESLFQLLPNYLFLSTEDGKQIKFPYPNRKFYGLNYLDGFPLLSDDGANLLPNLSMKMKMIFIISEEDATKKLNLIMTGIFSASDKILLNMRIN